MPLPAPMLAEPGPLPSRGCAYEVKWDGFRAIVGVDGDLQVRSRRGWNMTKLVPELAAIPAHVVLDGELVTFSEDGTPHFLDVCRRMLHADRTVPVVLLIFDPLELDGEPTMELPYRSRRELLESLRLEGPWWRTPDVFEDGKALYDAVCEHGLEGVVAKRLDGRCRPGERRWVKVKNPGYRRRESELAAFRSQR